MALNKRDLPDTDLMAPPSPKILANQQLGGPTASPPNPFFEAIENDDELTVKSMLADNNVYIQKKDQYDNTGLHKAVIAGKSSLVALLLNSANAL